jgi:hypothetical protein
MRSGALDQTLYLGRTATRDSRSRGDPDEVDFGSVFADDGAPVRGALPSTTGLLDALNASERHLRLQTAWRGQQRKVHCVHLLAIRATCFVRSSNS